MPNCCAIIIFAKAPVPGQVKTRLQPHLSAEECADLHSSFIYDTIDITRGVEGATVILACHPGIEHPFFQKISEAYGIQLVKQSGADLGDRMDNAIKDVLTAGYEKVIILGSDSPDLPAGYVREGLKALDTKDMVIGPSSDGGYYLIGGRRMLPVFDNIPWSSSAVFELTLEMALKHGIGFFVLPEWYDIDTWEDLQRFRDQKGQNQASNILTK